MNFGIRSCIWSEFLCYFGQNFSLNFYLWLFWWKFSSVIIFRSNDFQFFSKSLACRIRGFLIFLKRLILCRMNIFLFEERFLAGLFILIGRAGLENLFLDDTFQVLNLAFFWRADLKCKVTLFRIFQKIAKHIINSPISFISLQMEQGFLGLVKLVVDDAGPTNDKVFVVGRWFFPYQLL